MGIFTTVKGKVITGAAIGTVAVAGIVTVVMLNRGYRSIVIEEANGTTNVVSNSKTVTAYEGLQLVSGDDVTVLTDSDLTLAMDADKHVYAEPLTHFWLEASGKTDDTKTYIYMDEGCNLFRIDQKLNDKEEFKVDTPNASMSVRGTVFRVDLRTDELGDKYTIVQVFEGEVYVACKMENGSLTGEDTVLGAGQSAVIRSNTQISEFLRSEDGNIVGQIVYNTVSKNHAFKLGRAWDEGRTLSITKELLYDYVEIVDHKYEPGEVVVESTYDTHGYFYEICAVCGKEGDKIELPLLTREETNADKETELDLDTDIDASEILDETDTSKEDAIDHTANCKKGNHEYGQAKTIIEPTYEKDGLMGKTCKYCGSVDTKSSIILTKLTDNNADDNKDKNTGKNDAPTTGNDSNKDTPSDGSGNGGASGSDGDTGNKPSNLSSACAHSYSSKTLVEATCAGEGVKQYTCSKCSDTYNEKINPTGKHSYSEKLTTSPTCIAKGEKTFTCTVCSDSYKESVPATGKHTYSSKTTTEPTCVSKGVKTYTCSVCADSYTEDIAATGKHTYSEKITTQATCGTPGVKTYTCSVCADSYKEDIPATGKHSYKDTITTAATCVKKGLKTFNCANCKDTYTEDIPATGIHSYSSTVTKAATCKDKGIMTYTCKNCTDSYTEDIPLLTTHNYSYSVSANATCTRDGVGVYTCRVCSDSYNEPIAATGHVTTIQQNPDGSYTHQVRCSKCRELNSNPYVTCSGGGGFTRLNGDNDHNEICKDCGAVNPVYDHSFECPNASIAGYACSHDSETCAHSGCNEGFVVW